MLCDELNKFVLSKKPEVELKSQRLLKFSDFYENDKDIYISCRLFELIRIKSGSDKRFFWIIEQNTILNNIFEAEWFLSFPDHKQCRICFLLAFAQIKAVTRPLLVLNQTSRSDASDFSGSVLHFIPVFLAFLTLALVFG